MSLESPASGQDPGTDAGAPGRGPRRPVGIVVLVTVVLVAAGAAAYGLVDAKSSGPKASAPTTSDARALSAGHRDSGSRPPSASRTATVSPTSGVPTPTTTTAPTTTTTTVPATHGPITSPPLPPPGPGFNEGQVTAVGDSVMIDYETLLQQDIPGVNVQASVGEQWSAGEAELAQLKSEGQLGAVVVVGLSTNGPISSTDFANMMGILSGASRVVFVTVHVDRPWQDPNNAVLAAGVHQYPNTVLADWYGLVDQNPGWLYADDTHLPIDGPGAQALANLVAAQA